MHSNFPSINPLKRPYLYSQIDPELQKTNKRGYKLPQKEKKTFEDNEETRHFLLISSIKSIPAKPTPLYEFKNPSFSSKNHSLGVLDRVSRENIQEKQKKFQQELDLYKEQMAFYSKDCCFAETKDCSMHGFPENSYKLN